MLSPPQRVPYHSLCLLHYQCFSLYYIIFLISIQTCSFHTLKKNSFHLSYCLHDYPILQEKLPKRIVYNHFLQISILFSHYHCFPLSIVFSLPSQYVQYLPTSITITLVQWLIICSLDYCTFFFSLPWSAWYSSFSTQVILLNVGHIVSLCISLQWLCLLSRVKVQNGPQDSALSRLPYLWLSFKLLSPLFSSVPFLILNSWNHSCLRVLSVYPPAKIFPIFPHTPSSPTLGLHSETLLDTLFKA